MFVMFWHPWKSYPLSLFFHVDAGRYNGSDPLWSREMCKTPQMCKQSHLCRHFALNVQTTTLCKHGAHKCANLYLKKIHQPLMCKHDAVKCATVQVWREMCKHPTNLQIIVFVNQFTSTKLSTCIDGRLILSQTVKTSKQTKPYIGGIGGGTIFKGGGY